MCHVQKSRVLISNEDRSTEKGADTECINKFEWSMGNVSHFNDLRPKHASLQEEFDRYIFKKPERQVCSLVSNKRVFSSF